MSVWEMLSFVAAVMGLTVACMVFGGFLVFKSMRAVPGEKFLGGVPKGQVFTIPEADSAEEFPDAESTVLAKTERFLQTLAGGKL